MDSQKASKTYRIRTLRLTRKWNRIPTKKVEYRMGRKLKIILKSIRIKEQKLQNKHKKMAKRFYKS